MGEQVDDVALSWKNKSGIFELPEQQRHLKMSQEQRRHLKPSQLQNRAGEGYFCCNQISNQIANSSYYLLG